MSTYHPASLHTIKQVIFLHNLSERQASLLRERLNGKGVHLGVRDIYWYRWCDIVVALEGLGDVDKDAFGD